MTDTGNPTYVACRIGPADPACGFRCGKHPLDDYFRRHALANDRGINVGGKNELPMKDLAAMFADAGCDEVRTYIQSGNVVFQAPQALVRRVPAVITRAINDRCGFQIPVVTRTAAELGKVVAGNPFLQAGVDSGKLHVAFLAKRPAAARVAGLDPDRSPPDELIMRGREIYLHCPGGMARTKLTNAYFDSKLGTTSTVRSWNTVLELLAVAGGS